MKLYEKLRPTDFNQMIGQKHILKKESLLNNLINTNSSLLLFGPPGIGKTTFAKIYAKKLSSNFHALSSIFTSTAELKKIFKDAMNDSLTKEQCVIFVDEFHRFNKTQQDLFLPVMESGAVILIACTTENPSFALNNALISRSQALQFFSFEEADFHDLLVRIEDLEGKLNLSDEYLELIIKNSHGDARIFISNLEKIYALKKSKESLTDESLADILQVTPFKSDKNGDVHYAYFSAFQKSIRGSDDASAMLYFTKMIENGEDVLSIARRMLIIAAEDVGLADPQALVQVQTAIDAFRSVGYPEGLIIIAQAVNYLALAPKSNASYMSLKFARDFVAKNPELYPPKSILNPTTAIQRKEGYGKGYIYDHNEPNGFAGQDFFPSELRRQAFYRPKQVGFERDLSKRLEYFNKVRNSKKD
ncbi:MAG: replication-associated recombination protein A [Proteobacteria bacterium]|nr:replication-associated recombination protein A [Pseudomonadota bacterium]